MLEEDVGEGGVVQRVGDGDGPLEVLASKLELSTVDRSTAQRLMTPYERPRFTCLLTELEQLPAEPNGRVELGADDGQTPEAPHRGGQVAGVAEAGGKVVGPGSCLSHLRGRVAPSEGEHDRPAAVYVQLTPVTVSSGR